MRKVFIIAEAGVNHNGNIEMAKRLIAAAKTAGVDAVKFQTFKSENLVTRDAQRAEYQRTSGGISESQYEMIRGLELSEGAHRTLVAYCSELGIQFLSSAFDAESVSLLRSLGIHTWKIASGEITNLPLLRQVGAFGEQVLLSTGMATLGEVEAAISTLENAGTKRSSIVLLHCTTEYPAPLEEVNLLAMVSMGEAFKLGVGYSDHTMGLEIAVAAVALGASIIEKHFTLDRCLPGPDHKASLEPGELAQLVKEIRNIEMALGDGIKRPGIIELRNRDHVRKSIVASNPIKKGELFSSSNLTTKRPGGGTSPMEWDKILGQMATRDYAKDERL